MGLGELPQDPRIEVYLWDVASIDAIVYERTPAECER